MAKFTANKILGKVVKYGDNLIGKSSRQYSNTASALKGASGLGIKGVPGTTILRADRKAQVAKGRSFQTRVKTIAGVGLVGGGGFLGLHKYHQHKDNKILERIDKMYQGD